ncbi:unnamed protein product [Coffea canephora]|uniref:J domain-containing protein n=1 Tax=Coffea canephora TaxID=49390 RepID=A0A068U662_COFCA|nr:unnamed protein product [Coffea canephora]
MDDLDVLARDFGFRPQGKSNPMRSEGGDRRSSSARSSSSAAFYDDHGSNRDGFLFNDVFGGPPRYSNNNKSSSPGNDFDYDSIFKSSSSATANSNSNNHPKTSSAPVYDKPVYDEDIFDGLPGMKSKSESSAGKFDDDVFASMASPPRRSQSNNSSNNRNDQFDDLLGKLGRNERNNNKSSSSAGFDDLLGNITMNERKPEVKSSSSRSSSSRGFDDLFGGLAGGTPANSNRPVSESNQGRKSTSSFSQSTPNTMDDPFVVLDSTSPPVSSSAGVFVDPLEEIGRLGKSGSSKAGGVFDDLDPLNGFGKSSTPFSPEKGSRGKDRSPLMSGSSASDTQTPAGQDHARSSVRQSESHSKRNAPDDSFQEPPPFDVPNVSENLQKSYHQNASSPPRVSSNVNEINSPADASPRSQEHGQTLDDIWLTVFEIPLFTPPTNAPPPSRPPPPIPRRTSKAETGFFSSNTKKKSDDFASPPSYSSFSQSPNAAWTAGKGNYASQIDELEDFATGRTQNSVDESNVHLEEEMNASSVAAASAAAMKEAMDRAEAKFRHAKEVREREYAKVARSRENVHDMQDVQERDYRENQERLEKERLQREEEEREQRRLERERERAREIERERAREIERERARHAVERATREARERAAAEARLKAERAAVEKAQGEARERAERAAVQRAQNEARERAGAEARERAEKAAAEARERANAETREREARDRAASEKAAAEARRRAERAAVERAAAEARERAAAEAREKAAAAARANQQRNDNDFESFFSMNSRPSSAPRPRANSSETMFDTNFQSTGGPQGPKPTSFGGTSSNMRKASSTTNIVDDLSSIFAAPSSGEFQEVEGETEERRRARMERHQRTKERAAKALAEKNQRDIQALKEQEERYRIAETLDIEIKRWAAGKEGNLRALLSTLQYVLWPECGWQPVSLTDLITGPNVKKVYRKATLCIHPDKVQQKGATLQQKYIAEKVFDLLKEAWNKFNSEELF